MGGGDTVAGPSESDLPFVPIRLLVLYDNQRGYCARVLPNMLRLLEHRAFIVDTHDIADGAVDISSYKGLILGSPVFGLGLRGVGPTDALTTFVQHQLPDLDEHKVAVFCVHELRPGLTLDRMRGLVYEKGGGFVAGHAYSLLRPRNGEHVLPAECMVRIR